MNLRRLIGIARARRSLNALSQKKAIAEAVVKYLAQATEFRHESGENKKSRALLMLDKYGVDHDLANILIEEACYDYIQSFPFTDN